MKKTRVSLKYRIVAILCAVLVSTLLVSIVSAYQFFWPSFQEIEQSLAKQNAQRVENTIEHDLDTLDAFVADWALWDDSYNFINNRSDAYIQSNLQPPTFWQNNLSGIAYIGAQGRTVWAKSYDYGLDKMVAFPPEVEQFIARTISENGRLPEEGISGIVRVGDGFALMAAHGIQDSRMVETPTGALVMLRRFDEDFLDRLRHDTRSYVYAGSIYDRPSGERDQANALLDENVRTVWFDLPVVNDTDPIRFFVETSRTITDAAVRALSGDVISVAIGSLLVFIVMMIVLEFQLVRPLSVLCAGLIARQKNPMARLGINRLRDDEIGLIAQEVDRLQRRILEMALKDGLTGLPNRRLFDDRLERAVEQAYRRNTKIAVLFIDLDGFKPVNDKFGHQEGDRLLERVAKRFNNAIRTSDTLARFGGDEFATVVEFRKDARLGLEVLCRKLIQQLDRPFKVGDSYIRISASIGCAIYPDQAEDTVELLRMADEAMYEVKHKGKAAWLIHGGNGKADPDGDGRPELPFRAIR